MLIPIGPAKPKQNKQTSEDPTYGEPPAKEMATRPPPGSKIFTEPATKKTKTTAQANAGTTALGSIKKTTA